MHHCYIFSPNFYRSYFCLRSQIWVLVKERLLISDLKIIRVPPGGILYPYSNNFGIIKNLPDRFTFERYLNYHLLRIKVALFHVISFSFTERHWNKFANKFKQLYERSTIIKIDFGDSKTVILYLRQISHVFFCV